MGEEESIGNWGKGGTKQTSTFSLKSSLSVRGSMPKCQGRAGKLRDSLFGHVIPPSGIL